MIIGLLGCHINNENLGCQALSYSLLEILEEIRKEGDRHHIYYVFEGSPNESATEYVANQLGIATEYIVSFDVTPLFRFRRFLHHLKIGIKTFKAFRKCDVFIDLTAGDSFTDIYGQYIFDSETNVKYLVKRLGKKLILGPQTYGPFKTDKNKKKAARIINLADLVISRDQQSKDYLMSFTDNVCYAATDVAFILRYEHDGFDKIYKKRIGINVSGLLLNCKTESTPLLTKLKADYESYITRLTDYLLERDTYEIHIIPHVREDGVRWMHSRYGNSLIYYAPFRDPIEAKSIISNMDIFIGSRMHSTIASLSSDVVTIPVGYSRKFTGLFEHLEYPYVIDLANMTTSECVDKTIFEIENCDVLKQALNRSKEKWTREISFVKDLISDSLSRIENKS